MSSSPCPTSIPHTLRLVRTRDMAAGATIVLAASVEMGRTIDALGVRFLVEPAIVD